MGTKQRFIAAPLGAARVGSSDVASSLLSLGLAIMVEKVVILLGLIFLLLQPVAARAQEQQPQTAPCVTAVMAALSKKGFPYSWGAKGAHAFDCSGLTYWAYKQAGIDIGESTYDQAYYGTAINCNISHLSGGSTTCWAPGDLIFLKYNGGQHVAIYAGEGKFMDCYSPAVGCVLHSVEADAFYHAYFWQGRRIVSGCEGMTIDPGTPVPTPPYAIESPGVESVPDLVDYVSFTVPTLDSWWVVEPAPARPGSSDFIGGLLYGFLWLGWFVRMALRESLVGVFYLAQYGANFLASSINAVLIGVNGVWRLGVTAWLGAKAMFLGLWMLFEDMRSWLVSLSAYPQAWITAIFDVFTMVLNVIIEILNIFLAIIEGILGLFGWILGLCISLILLIVAQFTATTAPPELTAESDYYFMVHGILRGLVDSRIGWLIVLLWGLCYIGTLFYIASYFSRSEQASE